MSLPPCPNCQSEYVYQDQNQLVCSMCAFEWNPEELAEGDVVNIKDANGTLLSDGDKVTVIKDSSQVIKIGTTP